MDLHRAYPHAFRQAGADHLASLMGPFQEFRARQRIARAHVPITTALFLERGYVARDRSDRTGRRQFLDLHIPATSLTCRPACSASSTRTSIRSPESRCGRSRMPS